MTTWMKPCDGCGNDTPCFDLAGGDLVRPRFNAFYSGKETLCSRCLNEERRQQVGVAIKLPDRQHMHVHVSGTCYEFFVQPWVSSDGVGLVAFHMQEGAPEFQFQVTGNFKSDATELERELKSKIREGVTRHARSSETEPRPGLAFGHEWEDLREFDEEEAEAPGFCLTMRISADQRVEFQERTMELASAQAEKEARRLGLHPSAPRLAAKGPLPLVLMAGEADCTVCGERTPYYDLLELAILYPEREVLVGSEISCVRCFNERMIRKIEVPIELPRHERMTLSMGKAQVTFFIRPWVSPDGVGLLAFELTEGETPGHQFRVSGDFTADFGELRAELDKRIGAGLARGHVEFMKLANETSDFVVPEDVDIIRGRFAFDEEGGATYPGLVIDGEEILWKDLGRILKRFQGMQFRLEIKEPSADLT